jgi:hypothetical protein
MTITEEAKKALLSIRPCLAMARVITEYAEVAGMDMNSNDGIMRIDNEPFERLCIEKIDTNVISVSHYFEQNGDLVPDPDMVFFILDSYWYPVSFQNQLTYQESMEYDNDGQIVEILENIRSMISFTDTWADIISSQGYLEAVKPVGEENTE